MKTKLSMFWFWWWTCYFSLMGLMLSLAVTIFNMDLGMILMAICSGVTITSLLALAIGSVFWN